MMTQQASTHQWDTTHQENEAQKYIWSSQHMQQKAFGKIKSSSVLTKI